MFMANQLQNTSEMISRRPRAGFYFLWILSNGSGAIIGVIVTIVLMLLLGGDVSPSLPDHQTSIERAWKAFIFISVISIPFGSIVGAMQWIVLRRYLSKSSLWFTTGALAMFLSNAISFLTETTFQESNVFLTWFLFGGLSGVLQWIIIRKQIDYSWLWILINVIAGCVSGIFAPDSGIMGSSIGWALSGIITGGVLFFLLKKSNTESNTKGVA